MKTMSNFIRHINGVAYVDETRLWAAVSDKEHPLASRLGEIMRLAGVQFFEPENYGNKFVKEPLVAISGFGGFPVSFDETTPEGKLKILGAVLSPEEIVLALHNTMGRAGFYSYLNPGNHSPTDMNAITSKHRHFSKAHTAVVDLAIFGYSAAIEGNLMLLRRWFNHVGRLTTTRCHAQSAPPLVVMQPEDLPLAKALYESTQNALALVTPPVKRPQETTAEYQENLADYWERVNSYWPINKALILMVNADLSDLKSTMGDIADKGQEKEARQLLAKINDCLLPLFPELFQPAASYDYQKPAHWL
jgi:hypothetical protein